MTDWADWAGTAGNVAAAAAKGAAAGSIVPGIGTGVGALIGAATELVPALTREIAGDSTGTVAAKVAQTMQGAILDPATLADPEKVGQLRIELAKIAVDLENARNDAFATQIADIADARQHTISLAQSHSAMAWGAAVVSAIVLLTFGAVLTLTLLRSLPSSAEPVLNVLLGTLSAMATSVVSYWVGSSVGSARKDDRLASIALKDGGPT